MYVCAGACAGASVPPSLFANHAGGTSWKHCGAILRRFWDDFGSILDNFASIGHILVPPGTIFETPFPRFGKKSILRRFSGESGRHPGVPFSPLGISFSLCGVSEAENRCFFRQLGLRSHFGTISGQILGSTWGVHMQSAHACAGLVEVPLFIKTCLFVNFGVHFGGNFGSTNGTKSSMWLTFVVQ